MDKETFAKSFKEHNKSIYSFIYLKVNLQRNLAEDLAQETFLRAWNYRHTYNSKRSGIKTWLFRIAANVINDNYKKNRIQFEDLENYSELDFEEKFADKGLYLATIYKGLNRLSKIEKEAVILRYVEDLDLKEIAQIINKNYIATKVLIHRSINKLKKQINENQ